MFIEEELGEIAASAVKRIVIELDDKGDADGMVDTLSWADNFRQVYSNVTSIMIYGRGGNDDIRGPSGVLANVGENFKVTINGGDGDDTIRAFGGVITLIGGRGNDDLLVDHAIRSTIYGDRDDALRDHPDHGGNDMIRAFATKNTVWGGAGNDTILGNNVGEENTLYGGPGHDILRGGTDAKNTLSGGLGPDKLYAGTNSALDNELKGESGDDYLDDSNNASAKLDGGSGHTIVSKSGNSYLVVDDKNNEAVDWHPVVGGTTPETAAISKGGVAKLSASKVVDKGGNVPGIQVVEFYFDKSNDGEWDPHNDRFVGEGILQGTKWTIDVNTGVHLTAVERDRDEYLFFAVAIDRENWFNKAKPIVVTRLDEEENLGFDQFDHEVDLKLAVADHDEAMAVHYTITAGTAELGTHFDVVEPGASVGGGVATGTVTLAPNVTTVEIALHIKDFDQYEWTAGDRNFTVELTDDLGDPIGSATGTIRSFEFAVSFDGVSPQNEIHFDEDNDLAKAKVVISAAPFEGVSVDIRTNQATALDERDFSSQSTWVHFAAGNATPQEMYLNIRDDDVYERLPEFFRVNLSEPVAGKFLAGYDVGTVYIDDDPIPTLIVNDVEVTVGDDALFFFSLSNPSAEAITIAYATLDGSALDGVDYGGVIGTVTFAPEEIWTDDVAVATYPDYEEGTKEFYLTFLSADYVTLPENDAVAVILDGQEWVDGYLDGHYELQNLGTWVRRWVGEHWVDDYYVAPHYEGTNWIEGAWTGGNWVEGYWEGGEYFAGYYEGGTFVPGRYIDGAWVEGYFHDDQWTEAHWEGGTFIAGHYVGGEFIPGHNETRWVEPVYDGDGNLLVEGYEETYWVDDQQIGGTWVDDEWINREWIEGYYAIHDWIAGFFEQLWVDEHWENQSWVEEYWLNRTWVEGWWENRTWVEAHWESEIWVEGHWVGHMEADYVDELVDDWQEVWIEEWIEGHWRVT